MQEITNSTIVCPQCAGENQVPIDDKFTECVYCGSAIYIDKSKVVSHFVITPNFKQQDAEGNLRRWMAGNFHVKDLDKLAQITQVSFYYFPMWYFKTNEAAGDVIYLQPATSTSISEIKKINIPAGNLKVYNKKEFDESQFMPPDVLFDSAQSWLTQQGVNMDTIALSNLVHIPFYQFYYVYEGQQYSALVEASSGMVYANMWPAKKETPFRLMFAASIIAFVVVSLIALGIGSVAHGRGNFFVTVTTVKIIGYIIASVPLIIMAYLVAKKV